MNEITIKKALKRDSVAIARCLFLAMKDVLCTIFNEKDKNTTLTILTHFVNSNNNLYSYENCWVAEQNNKIVGAVNIYEGKIFHQLNEPVVEYLTKVKNKKIIVEKEAKDGEYYIDSIGVLKEEQGKGIGTKILSFLINEYVVERKETLGLLVEVINENAVKLYLKLGFEIIGDQYLAGKKMKHMQLK